MKLNLDPIGYSHLSQAQLQELIQGLHPIAWKPNPENTAQGVLQPLLQWTASDTGVTHDVYLGQETVKGAVLAGRGSSRAPRPGSGAQTCFCVERGK